MKKNRISEILELYNDPSTIGKKFERCADIIIKCGFLPLFSNDTYKHIIGNVNLGKPEILQSLKK